MTIERSHAFAAIVLLLALLYAPGIAAQADQAAIARGVLSTDPAHRERALASALAIPPERTRADLRAALIGALEREGREMKEAYWRFRRGEPQPPGADPEFILPLARAVARLRDAAAIPALAGALGTGGTVIRALVDLGEDAVPALLMVVEAEDSPPAAVNDGLIALRFLAERVDVHPLSPAVLRRITDVARARLLDTQPLDRTGGTLRWTIDLAIALGDPELRAMVRTIAGEQDQLVLRGITDPDDIARARQRARDRLAGAPPLPAW